MPKHSFSKQMIVAMDHVNSLRVIISFRAKPFPFAIKQKEMEVAENDLINTYQTRHIVIALRIVHSTKINTFLYLGDETAKCLTPPDH